jgi:hypothetical protein
MNDYSSIPDNNSLDLGTAGSFTIEGFFYVPSLTNEGVQVLFYKNYAYELAINFHAGAPDYVFLNVWSCSASFCQNQLGQNTNISMGWHHIAVVYENTSAQDTFTIYLDGSRLVYANNANFNPGINNSTSALYVGGYFGVAAWNGFMDEVRLSDAIRYSGASYTVPPGAFTSDANARALWHFNEPVGSTSFADASGNGNTLAGFNGAATASPPGAPVLSIGISTNNILISWPSWAEGYSLEGTTSLSPPITWLAVTNSPIVAGNQKTVTLNNVGTDMFFRLRKP